VNIPVNQRVLIIEGPMSINKAYHYFFYKLYKFSEAAPSRWWSDWKAGLAMDVLLFFFVLSLLIYYNVFFDRHFDFEEKIYFILFYLLLITVPNYLIFHHRDGWKTYLSEFEGYSKKKDLIGSIVVILIIVLVIANLILSFYFMSKVDWSLYR
jgi:hypothetical protein